MRIGTRWPVGGDAPASLPPILREAVAAEERALVDLGADTTGWGWTLTFLEGSPVVECDEHLAAVRRDEAGLHAEVTALR